MTRAQLAAARGPRHPGCTATHRAGTLVRRPGSRLTGDEPDEDLRRWALKGAASRAIVELGGTISHQHGVGADHAPYLGAEKGELGLAALRDVFRRFDPDGRMNPGKLMPSGGADVAPGEREDPDDRQGD